MTPAEILKKPYARMVTPDEDGSYFAEIVEFPGCFASGRTSGEALENLEIVAVDWINSTVAQGQDIPLPMESNDYSGRFVLRMLKSLHKRAALWAHREGVSLNQFIVNCVAEAIGMRARPSLATVPPTSWSFQIGITGSGAFPITMAAGNQQHLSTQVGQLSTTREGGDLPIDR